MIPGTVLDTFACLATMADAVPSQSTPAAPAPTKVGMMWSDLSAAKLEEIRAEPAAGEKIRCVGGLGV